MTIAEMHWQFDFRYNKINSNAKKQLTPLEKDTLLNHATFQFVERMYNSIDETQRDMDAINTLISEETITSFTNDKLLYTSLTNDYFHFVDMTVTTSCGTYKCTVVQHDDIQSWLSDPLREPSKKWKLALITFTGDGIKIYLPSGETITSANITYLRYPTLVYYGTYSQPSFTYTGYDSVEYITSGTGYQTGNAPVNSNLPAAYHHVIVDMAVEQAAKNLYDEFQVQVRKDNNTIIQ